MRLTINLDQENYLVAKSMAKEAECSIGKVVNELLRKALEPSLIPIGRGMHLDEDGLPIVKGRKAITSDDVYRIESESLILNDGNTP